MRQTILTVALLGALATSNGLFAHEGAHHDATMGTIKAIDAEEMTLTVGKEEAVTFALTDSTSYVRGNQAVSREDVAVTERAVVTYETKDGVNAAIEVKLAPRSE